MFASPTSLAQATPAADASPAAPSLMGFVGSVVGAVVVNVGSVALTALQAVEALVAGGSLDEAAAVLERSEHVGAELGRAGIELSEGRITRLLVVEDLAEFVRGGGALVAGSAAA